VLNACAGQGDVYCERATAADVPAGAPTPPATVGEVSGPKLVRASEVEPQNITWLWNEWIARGKLEILAGQPGTGKSTVTCNLVAIVSSGGKWPDGTQCESAGNVLIWSGEDDAADTIIPRLIAAGANLERVYLIHGARTPDGKGYLPFDPSRDVAQLRGEIERIGGAVLVIVDPIVSAVAGDMHKANDVRRSLQALVDFGAEFDCAIIGISHFSKGSGGNNPTERVIGSQAFGALGRIVMICAKDEEGTTRVLMRSKSNIGPDFGGFKYSLDPALIQAGNPPKPIATVRITWGEPTNATARAILKSFEAEKEHESADSANGKCAESMRALLTGPDGALIEVNCREVTDVLEKAGFSERRIRTAKEKLGVTYRHGEEFPKVTYWKLPGLEPVEGFLPAPNA
jgi:hypothetical protein